MPPFLTSLIGILVILGIAFCLSNGKRRIRLRVAAAAFALQALMAVIVLRVPLGQTAIQGLSNGVIALLNYSTVGIEAVFGSMETNPFANSFVIAALPVIVFFAALVSILYHLKIMQLLVRWVGGAIGWITGIGKVEALGSAANIFVGQSESPLVVRPYLASLKPAQIFTLMSVGMAGVAGTILAAYASFIGTQAVPFLLAAAFMSAPGGILMAKIIYPDEPDAVPEGAVPIRQAEVGGTTAEGPGALDGGRPHEVAVAETFEEGEKPANIIEAAAQGAMTGVRLAVAVGALVMVFVALVALANGALGGIGGLFGFPDVTFQQLLGYVFAPVMYLIGIPWGEAQFAGGLFGTKVVLNEFVAFIELGEPGDNVLSERSRAIVTFALCGFANFSSIAIQMAVTGGLAPNQRPVIARLGLRALAAGSLANLMSAALAGLLLA
ncbi:nucleoside transporter C-terminal domain-containing protein [Qipengyuania sp. JC766]|uniref:NupC/NupG family nucleoside CNT transporter n=1 Tax=Qipengyuania sp. JC766 TaxID=3232139 RepID=UPI0034598A76